jgi:hypothetical protein
VLATRQDTLSSIDGTARPSITSNRWYGVSAGGQLLEKLRHFKILIHHPRDNYFFYFDVSFEETLRRHKTRKKSVLLTMEKMQELYSRTTPSEYPGERIIPEATDVEQAYQLIIQTASLQVTPL